AGGPIDLRAMTAQALQMGDEGHNRNVAATSLLTRAIAPTLVATLDGSTPHDVLAFLKGNDHFFLNLSMAACKSALDAASGIEGSTVVTAMSRNGVDFGIRLSGTGNAWFTSPVGVPDGLYFPGYGPADANPDVGDSAITETAGIGGFAMAAAPAIVRFVGGTAADALRYSTEMGLIALAHNPAYALPSLDFVGSPTAIDSRRVMAAARAAGMLVVHTREGHRPDLADCPPSKRSRGRLPVGIGDVGPMGRILVRGEPGHEIVPELAPLPGEPVVDKPGKGAFYA